MSSNDVVITVGVIGNILSVVGVVICNKYITEVDGFNFMIFLSFLHFVFTAIGCRVMLMCNVFSWSPATFSSVLPLAIGSLLSVAFMNLNLATNSVGFYQVITLHNFLLYLSLLHTFILQLSKLACIPVTLWIQYVAYNTSVSRSVQMTLVPITFGVGYATIYDIEVRTIGLGIPQVAFCMYKLLLMSANVFLLQYLQYVL